MSAYTQDQLNDIFANHKKWLTGADGGVRANLRYADLSYADLRYANLSSANLSYADLSYANLSSANLSYANLSSANLSYADLSSANLRYADLSYADLRYADLSYADLSSANLRYAAGELKHLKSLFLDTYPITYTAEVMQIGCERHEIAKWQSFSDAEIRKMDGLKALEFWAKYKAFIFQAIELSPAAPTGFVEKAEAEGAAMKSIQQATAEAIQQAYKQGKINLSESWAVIGVDDALAVFKAIIARAQQSDREILLSDYPTRDTQADFVQRRVERAWNDLCILQAELGQSAHEYNQRKDSTENAR